jgi:hypothetical protein
MRDSYTAAVMRRQLPCVHRPAAPYWLDPLEVLEGFVGHRVADGGLPSTSRSATPLTSAGW